MAKFQAALLFTVLIAAGGISPPASATPTFSFSITKTGNACPDASLFSYPGSDNCVSGDLTVTNDSTDWSITGFVLGTGGFDAAEAEISANATAPANTDWGARL